MSGRYPALQEIEESLDAMNDEFDYDEFVKEEFGSENKIRPRGISWFWWLAAVLLLAALLIWLVPH